MARLRHTDWPDRLWIVRHGQSAGNVARDRAELAQDHLIELQTRDADTPLSALGQEQARALGQWFARLPPEQRPTTLMSSPFVRSRQTMEAVARALGTRPDDVLVDERLREKEFGVLDGYTTAGIRARFPELAAQRASVGKFYFRPPGGESWCDVILRLRSALDTISLHHGGQRVLVVSHQVVVLCLRYLLEGMTEDEILAIDRDGDVANCAVTEYAFDPAQGHSGRMRLKRYNFVAPLAEAGAPLTSEPDANLAVR